METLCQFQAGKKKINKSIDLNEFKEVFGAQIYSETYPCSQPSFHHIHDYGILKPGSWIWPDRSALRHRLPC